MRKTGRTLRNGVPSIVCGIKIEKSNSKFLIRSFVLCRTVDPGIFSNLGRPGSSTRHPPFGTSKKCHLGAELSTIHMAVPVPINKSKNIHATTGLIRPARLLRAAFVFFCTSVQHNDPRSASSITARIDLSPNLKLLWTLTLTAQT